MSTSKYVKTIGTSAFQNCIGLNTLIIPENVTMIDSYALSGLTKMTELYLVPTTPPALETIPGGVFTNLPTSCIIYIPQGTYSDYTYNNPYNYPNYNTYTYTEYDMTLLETHLLELVEDSRGNYISLEV